MTTYYSEEAVRQLLYQEQQSTRFNDMIVGSLMTRGFMTRIETKNYFNAKFSKFQTKVNDIVRKEVRETLANTPVIQKMLDSTANDLQQLHQTQMVVTKKQMHDAATTAVANVLSTDQGSALTRMLDERYDSRQRSQFYSSMFCVFVAGLIGGATAHYAYNNSKSNGGR